MRWLALQDYDGIEKDDELEIADPHRELRQSELVVFNRTKQKELGVFHTLTPRQVEIVLQGGLLNYTGKNQ